MLLFRMTFSLPSTSCLLKLPIVHRSRTESTEKIYTVADKQDQQLDPSVDVELNPGPSKYEKKDVVRPPTISILELRLHQFGLKPLDVGGAGDCFFRASTNVQNYFQ